MNFLIAIKSKKCHMAFQLYPLVHDSYKVQVGICILCYSVHGANLCFSISINLLLIVSESELLDCD